MAVLVRPHLRVADVGGAALDRPDQGISGTLQRRSGRGGLGGGHPLGAGEFGLREGSEQLKRRAPTVRSAHVAGVEEVHSVVHHNAAAGVAAMAFIGLTWGQCDCGIAPVHQIGAGHMCPELRHASVRRDATDSKRDTCRHAQPGRSGR